MKNAIRLTVAASILALGGCATAPQQPIAFHQDAFNKGQPSKIGVVMTPIPKVDTYLPGAGCLLCYAAAAAANSTLNSYSHTLPVEDLPNLKKQVADVLVKRGLDAVVIDEPLDVKKLPRAHAEGPNLARQDFTALKAKYHVDKLLVIDVELLGFVRTYASYIPTSDPKAEFNGLGYIVDLNTNAFDWYNPVSIVKSSDGQWKEPPKFPGLTNAYFQTLELGKDGFVKPLAQ